MPGKKGGCGLYRFNLNVEVGHRTRRGKKILKRVCMRQILESVDFLWGRGAGGGRKPEEEKLGVFKMMLHQITRTRNCCVITGTRNDHIKQYK